MFTKSIQYFIFYIAAFIYFWLTVVAPVPFGTKNILQICFGLVMAMESLIPIVSLFFKHITTKEKCSYKTNRFLTANMEELSYVAGELLEMDYDTVTIVHAEDGYSMKVNQETIPVPDEWIDSIESLYENGIQDISCGGGFVDFTMWSVMDESRGIKYSAAGTKPDGEQLIEVRQLSKGNWYYYVHNYEKAKGMNPEKFKAIPHNSNGTIAPSDFSSV